MGLEEYTYKYPSYRRYVRAFGHTYRRLWEDQQRFMIGTDDAEAARAASLVTSSQPDYWGVTFTGFIPWSQVECLLKHYLFVMVSYTEFPVHAESKNAYFAFTQDYVVAGAFGFTAIERGRYDRPVPKSEAQVREEIHEYRFVEGRWRRVR